MVAVECIDLSKDFPLGFWRKRPVRALAALNLSIAEGEIFGLLGHNGAGKTTTIKLLLRLIFPSRGTARILGLPLGAPGLAAQIGYLPENPYFYDYLRCRELVEYYAELAGVPAGERGARARAALERVGMGEAMERPLRKCSKGMVQRVGLAQAIVHRPKLAILDEPMSGLDPAGRAEVRDLILELRGQGTTVLFSTHILSDAEQLCDRVAVLKRGRLAAAGTLDELGGNDGTQAEIVYRERAGSGLGLIRREVIAAADLWPRLEALRARQAQIIAVNSARRGLEELFRPEAGERAASRSAGQGS
ncbi:MAG: ABC transporter ATP-binding protein [Terriglobales bacterium]